MHDDDTQDQERHQERYREALIYKACHCFCFTNKHKDSFLSHQIARKRAEEMERRKRILNAKVRTIGVDKETLDAQVAMKEESDAFEKELTRAYLMHRCIYSCLQI